MIERASAAPGHADAEIAAPLAALRARGVALRHPGGVEALRGVDLEIPAGTFAALVGPNGAGKSSLARILAGLLAPSAGAVEIEGRPIAALERRDLARRLAFLAQEMPQDLAFSAAEVVLMGRAPHLGPLGLDGEADRARAAAALARVDAAALADRPMHALSGGERRRIHLARVLAQEAPIWILDEPTAHLDLAHQQLVLHLAREHADQGGTVVCVLHDLGQAAAVADRVAVLQKGRLVAAGAPGDVLTQALLQEVFGVPFRILVDPDTGAEHLLPAAQSARKPVRSPKQGRARRS